MRKAKIFSTVRYTNTGIVFIVLQASRSLTAFIVTPLKKFLGFAMYQQAHNQDIFRKGEDQTLE